MATCHCLWVGVLNSGPWSWSPHCEVCCWSRYTLLTGTHMLPWYSRWLAYMWCHFLLSVFTAPASGQFCETNWKPCSKVDRCKRGIVVDCVVIDDMMPYTAICFHLSQLSSVKKHSCGSHFSHPCKKACGSTVPVNQNTKTSGDIFQITFQSLDTLSIKISYMY